MLAPVVPPRTWLVNLESEFPVFTGGYSSHLPKTTGEAIGIQVTNFLSYFSNTQFVFKKHCLGSLDTDLSDVLGNINTVFILKLLAELGQGESKMVSYTLDGEVTVGVDLPNVAADFLHMLLVFL